MATRRTTKGPPSSLTRWIWVAFGFFLIVGFASLWASRRSEPAPTSAPKPDDPLAANVVIYMIDTLRADRLGLYGYDKPTSPTIDQLATESIVFENCSSPAPWTLPSVASLMTSMFPCEHGVLIDGQRIPQDSTPLAERFKKLSYATASLFVNPYAGPMTGLDRGFDVCTPMRLIQGPDVDRWLAETPRRPFFLYVHNVEPHDPYRTPPQYSADFGAVSNEFRTRLEGTLNGFRKLTRVDFATRRPPGATDNTDKQYEAMAAIQSMGPELSNLYDASVKYADHNLATVIETLKSRGVWDDTLFIVMSDHGEEMGEHGGWQHDQSAYQELIHVPLIVRFPKGRYGGHRVDAAVSLVDVMPTIFDILGRRDLVTDCRGESLLPLIRKESAVNEASLRVTSLRDNRKKYFRPFKESRGDVNVVVRQGTWKGIWNAEPPSFELYNLQTDAGEKQNLAETVTERAELLSTYAKGWLEACRTGKPVAAPGRIQELDAETQEKLRSLGYVD